MRLKEFILEARRNPRLNPKIAINQILIDRLKATEDYIADTDNLFVSFTAIDKLGVNPRSRYNTPLGIYAYPAKYVQAVTGRYKSMYTLPFAGANPYVNIFSTKGNIINLNQINDEKLNNYYQKIINLYAKYSNDKSSNQITNLINQADYEANYHNNGGYLWYVTMMASKLLANIPEWKNFNYSISWTKLFRSIGIDGCVDLGTGIIHKNEPTQAVFFDVNTIVDNQRFLNKYSPTVVRRQEQLGQINIQEKQKVNQRIKEILNQSDSEDNLTRLFDNDPRFIRYAKLTLIPKQLVIDIFAKIHHTLPILIRFLNIYKNF